MYPLLIGASGILGLIVGSFLNVVILRINTGMGIGGRSRCFSCNQTLQWYELLPVASYVIQQGKCRTCKSHISIQYPIVELVTASAFILPVLAFPILEVSSLVAIMLAWIVASVSIVVSAYDIKHQMIPVAGLVVLLGLGAVLFFLPSLFDMSLGISVAVSWLQRLLAGLLIPLPFFVLWMVSKGRLFGLGDVELMVPIGLSLGAVMGVLSIFVAFWSATIVVGILLLVKSRLLRARNGGILKQSIPFGPFLLGSWYVMLVFGHHILSYLGTIFTL